MQLPLTMDGAKTDVDDVAGRVGASSPRTKPPSSPCSPCERDIPAVAVLPAYPHTSPPTPPPEPGHHHHPGGYVYPPPEHPEAEGIDLETKRHLHNQPRHHHPESAHKQFQTSFLQAVHAGDRHRLENILAEGVCPLNINCYDQEGQTALHHCCFEGNLELVKVLVNFGADPRLANRDGWNPMHIATFGGHRDITTFLLEAHKR